MLAVEQRYSRVRSFWERGGGGRSTIPERLAVYGRNIMSFFLMYPGFFWAIRGQKV